MTHALPPIMSVRWHQLRIPFRFRYGHAARVHNGVESVYCEVIAGDGITGWGECVPRPYVSGETVASVMEDGPALSPATFEADPFAALDQRTADWPSGRPWPAAALCALENALLDAAGKAAQQPVAALFGDASNSPVTLTASIGIAPPAVLISLCLAYRAKGFRSFKIKVGRDDDLGRLRLIRRVLGNDVRIYADANSAWPLEEATRRIHALADAGVYAIEEPLTPPGGVRQDLHDRRSVITPAFLDDVDRLAEQVSTPLVADESITSPSGLKELLQRPGYQRFNIRLSKNGGFRHANRMCHAIHAADRAFHVCAMVGETPLLAYAGTALAALHPAHRVAQGHSDRLLLQAVPAHPRGRIRHGGKITPLAGPGWGLTVSPKALTPFLVRTQTVTP